MSVRQTMAMAFVNYFHNSVYVFNAIEAREHRKTNGKRKRRQIAMLIIIRSN